MRAAFIGAYGYGNLGDELCLIEAMQHFPHTEAHVYTVSPEWTKRCVPGVAGTFPGAEQVLSLKPDMVVFGGGGIGKLPGLDRYSGLMRKLQRQNAVCHVHNIGVGRITDLSWLDQERREFFRALDVFSVRDFKSAEFVSEWPIGRVPEVTYFPERLVEPDFSVADAILPKGRKLLGISIIGIDLMNRALEQNAKKVRRLLAPYADHAVVPIVSTIHIREETEKDNLAFQRFAREFLTGFEIVATEFLDPAWWWQHLTPPTLKGVVARCDTLISHRKHNCVHGIGSRVKTIGLHPIADDSLTRTFVTLANFLVPGSRSIGLVADP